MDIETRKKISRAMKGKSNFEGHKHTHASKIAIAFSQEGHKNAKDHKWAVDKETGKETRVKPGAHLPRGNKWGRTAGFKEWIKEEVLLEKKKVADAIEDFTQFAKQHLNLDSLPQIDLNYDLEAAEKFGAFGGYYPEEQRIELNVAGRHTMDILRTLAHELVHYRQGSTEPLPEDAGDTGSPYENEANALAGVMMREYGQQNAGMFSENFMDGRNPQDKGDVARHGLKNKTMAQLKKIRSSKTATPRQKQLAHWSINMHKESVVMEDLRKWFREKWVRMDTKGNIKGDCAREPGEGKPKCLPLAKARAMDKKDRATATRRKRREDPNPDRRGAPINVKTEEYNNSVKRLEGTTSLAKIYKKDTPGQTNKTLKEQNMNSYSNWNNAEPVKYAKHLEKFFGKPKELTDNRAIWHDVDSFKRIEVLDEYIMHASPAPHHDFVYCYLDLKVPTNLANKLAESSESITIDFLKNEVGARCASLAANAVTLNYVMDVVEKKITPSKQAYEKRIMDMHAMFENGKRFQLDWWPDTTKDTDPKNPYYKLTESCNHSKEENMINEKNVPTQPEKWAQAKAQAKQKFDVYPSAYANGWAAKKYKAMGGSWKSVAEASSPAQQAAIAIAKKNDEPGQNKRSLKQLREMIGQKPKCDVCGDNMVRGRKHECTVKEARMSAAMKLHRAFTREQEKSAASRARAEKLLNPTPPAPLTPKK
jgi:hypothetical protein